MKKCFIWILMFLVVFFYSAAVSANSASRWKNGILEFYDTSSLEVIDVMAPTKMMLDFTGDCYLYEGDGYDGITMTYLTPITVTSLTGGEASHRRPIRISPIVGGRGFAFGGLLDTGRQCAPAQPTIVEPYGISPGGLGPASIPGRGTLIRIQFRPGACPSRLAMEIE